MIPSSFTVIAGEQGIMENWLLSILPILDPEDQLIMTLNIGFDFDLKVKVPCEVVLTRVSRLHRWEWCRMVNFGIKLATKNLVYQFDADKLILEPEKFRLSTEKLHSADDSLMVIGPILDHPSLGDDFSDGRRQALDPSVCWGGNVSFLRKNMVLYDERFAGEWGCDDREWAFRMVHEKNCKIAWCEETKVRHVPHKIQGDHTWTANYQLLDELNEQTLKRMGKEKL